MSHSTHILLGVILIAAIQTASAEPQTNVAATSAPSARHIYLKRYLLFADGAASGAHQEPIAIHRAPRTGTAISTVPGGGTLPRSSSRAGSTGPSKG